MTIAVAAASVPSSLTSTKDSGNSQMKNKWVKNVGIKKGDSSLRQRNENRFRKNGNIFNTRA